LNGKIVSARTQINYFERAFGMAAVDIKIYKDILEKLPDATSILVA
jgi:hypothetical protein